MPVEIVAQILKGESVFIQDFNQPIEGVNGDKNFYTIFYLNGPKLSSGQFTVPPWKTHDSQHLSRKLFKLSFQG